MHKMGGREGGPGGRIVIPMPEALRAAGKKVSYCEKQILGESQLHYLGKFN
jgi:hypothetical protein